VARVAAATGIADARAGMTPADKLEALAGAGRRVLMVGNGINDAPALAVAHASMSPAAASDVSRAAAGLVFTGERLEPVLFGLGTARMARSRALENFGLAAAYNAVAIPLAIAGMVTPLIAALAMFGSSIVVTLKALRLRGGKMTVLGILIPISVGLGLLGLVAFLWALKNNQYEDLEGDQARVLFNEKDSPDE